MTQEKFLFVDDSEDALEVLELFVESEYENEIQKASSGNEAMEILKNDSSFTLIVSDFNMPNGSGSELFTFVNESKLNIPFILLCGEEVSSMEEMPEFQVLKNRDANCIISKPFKRDTIIKAITENIEKRNSFFGDSKKAAEPAPVAAPNENIKDSYNRISIDKFFKFNATNIDVYIKLSNVKFIKIIEESSEDSKEIIEKYARKGIKYLYLKKKDYQDFMKEISGELSNILKNSVDIKQSIEAQFDTVESIHDSIRSLGVNKESMALADQAVKSCVKILKKSPNLSVLLDQLMKNKNYIYDLSMINSYLSVAIAKETDWASEKTYEKLALASLILDISLDNPDHAKIMKLESKEFKALSEEEQNIVKDHPFESVKLLDEVEDFSNDIRNIILEHHEFPSGEGFPRKLTHNKISPLSAIMIISQFYAHTIITEGKSPEVISKIMTELKENYDKGNFKKPLKAFFTAMDK